MKKRFEYLRPTTALEAADAKARYGRSGRCWAGGTDLMLLWQNGQVDLEYCIDLTFVSELKSIASGDREVRIGAMATLDDLDRASGINGLMAVLGATARVMCTPQTRTIATVGGNVCHAAPSADLPPLLVALDARVEILSLSGRRTVAMEDFFQGPNRTALNDDEILVEIRVPVPSSAREASYRRVSRTVVDIALAGAAVSVTADAAGTIAEARIVLGAVAPVPLRSRAAERVLVGCDISRIDRAVLAESARLASEDAKPISDLRASAEYRKAMTEILTRHTMEDSIRKLGGNPR